MSTLQCEQCGMMWPVEDFPDFTEGIVCATCLAGHDVEAARKKLVAKTQEMSRELLDVKDVSELMPKVRTILAEVYSQFGGPRGFATKVHWMVEELCRRKPIPVAAAQLMINLMKLHLSIEQTDIVIDAKNLTDEQIRNEQRLALMQMTIEAAGDPAKKEMLFELLKRQGIYAHEMGPIEMQQSVIEQVAKLE